MLLIQGEQHFIRYFNPQFSLLMLLKLLPNKLFSNTHDTGFNTLGNCNQGVLLELKRIKFFVKSANIN
ncbi:hypothetical protein GCM10011338_26220 [Alteromonas lipolytica]|uniref:Uncharacterized protein n=1 Tax=Alteromonas lipolytica TaxID=1856405 RepID=A0A1E8FA71_9ALTE|nr:hypothetical protein BFC17_06605 [Alteromonas lipolytica]GGF72802.1 hypothetical protein GCM10011338_26220 [Alteromonas lipolytica]